MLNFWSKVMRNTPDYTEATMDDLISELKFTFEQRLNRKEAPFYDFYDIGKSSPTMPMY